MLKKTFACTLVPVVSLFLLTLAGEVCLRVYHFLKEGMPIERWPEYLVGHYWTTTLDDELGWKATENYRLIRQEETAEGKPYDLRLSQDAQGFRQFGNVASKKPKILSLGTPLPRPVKCRMGNRTMRLWVNGLMPKCLPTASKITGRCKN